MAKANLEHVIIDLRKSLAWLDLVLSTLNEGVITLEEDMRIHFANDAIGDILKKDRIFLLGSPVWDVLPLIKDGKVLEKKDYIAAVKKNIQSLSGVYSLTSDTKMLTVEVTIGYIPKLQQTIIVVRDVTKQKEDEKALLQETAIVKLHQQVAVAANESTSFEEAMNTCVKLLCSYMGWPLGHVYLVTSNKKLISTDIWYGKNRQKFAAFRQITQTNKVKIGEGLPGRVLLSGKPAWITDVNNDDNFPRATQAKKDGIKAGVAFPVLTGEEIVAVLEFFSTDAIEPDDHLLEVMAHIGTQLGRVVERYRIEEERLKLLREQIARAEAEMLQKRSEFLSNASKILSSELDYTITLRNIAKLSVPYFADWCIVYMKDQEGNIQRISMEFEDHSDAQVAKKVNEQFPIHKDAKGGIMEVFRTGKPLFYTHASSQELAQDVENSEELESVLKNLQIKSWICVPIKIKSEVIGVISFITSKSQRRYLPIDLIFAEELAQRAAIAIENAILYTQSQQAIVLRDDFISLASHELKTPVTSLKLYTQALQKEFEKRGEKAVVKNFDKIDNQINKLTLLIHDLLNITKLQSGMLEFNFNEFSLAELIADVVDSIQSSTEKHTIFIQGSMKKKVYGDKDRIGQVLSNLLTNAIKYSPNADRIIINQVYDKDSVTVTVQDFGIGISTEHQDKIFGRFYRVTGSEEKTFPGLGIGLYISYEIIKRHGGTMKVTSSKGNGSAFSFTLPLTRRITKRKAQTV